MRFRIRTLWLGITIIALSMTSPGFSDACSAFIIGKDATADGSVILGGADDWPGFAGRVARVEQKEHKNGETYLLISGAEIPQAPVTYAYNYNSSVYELGTRKEASWMYGVNENQVAVSMAGTYNFKEIKADSPKALQGDDLTTLVLERATSARHAVELLGALIDEYGFKISDPASGWGAVTVAIADANEGWWFEPIPGGKWIAQRVADHKVSFRPNCYGTTAVNVKDNKNFILSKGLVEYATGQGWFDPKTETFDFVKAYTFETNNPEDWGATQDINNLRRWRYACLFSGKDMPLDEFIYEVVPDRKLTIQDAMAVFRDHLQGTEYDPAESAAGGEFKNPFPTGFGNTINHGGTVASQIAQLRNWMPNEIGGVMWLALDTPTTSVYIPWYVGINSIPETYILARSGEYDEKAAWWVFNEVGNLVRRMYNKAAVEDVIPAWQKFEKEQFEVVGAMEKVALELYKTSGKEATSQFLTTFSGNQGLRAYEKAKGLANMLRGKYSDATVAGTVVTD
jgi:dipeptidase